MISTMNDDYEIDESLDPINKTESDSKFLSAQKYPESSHLISRNCLLVIIYKKLYAEQLIYINLSKF